MDSTTSWAEALRELTLLHEPFQERFGNENFLRAARFRLEGRALFEGAVLPAMEPGKTYDVVVGFVDREVGKAIGTLDAELYAGFESAVICERGTQNFIFLGLAENLTTEGLPPGGPAPI